MPISPVPETRRVPPLGAFLEGWRRTLRAPVLVIGTATAVGLATALVETAASGTASVFGARAPLPPIASVPWTVGVQLFYGQLEQLSRLLAPEFVRIFHSKPMPLSWIAAQTITVGLWLFLTGGALDRLARGRPILTAPFFAACGVFFFRFLRLAVIVGLPVWMLLRSTRVAVGSPSAQAAALLVAAIVALVVDFAKVRAVVEDRRSMIGAVLAAIRFIRRRVWRVLVLSFLNALAVLIVLRIDFQVASTPAPAWLAGLMSAGVVLLAVWTRLATMAAEVAFFQGELAHAGYTAAPLPVWPDSAAVEAMDNLVKSAAIQNSKCKIQD